jgi:ABC-type Mn2+/Zn2+ transport system ATPase subunit
MTIVGIKDLDFAYHRETVLTDVNLTVRHKDFMAIIGPNRCWRTMRRNRDD